MEAYGGMLPTPLKLKGEVCYGLTKNNTRCKRKACCDSYYCSTHEELYRFEKPDECSICIEELKEDVRPAVCGHYMHSECLEKWLKTNHSCPVCRTLLRDKVLVGGDALEWLMRELRETTTVFPSLNMSIQQH